MSELIHTLIECNKTDCKFNKEALRSFKESYFCQAEEIRLTVWEDGYHNTLICRTIAFESKSGNQSLASQEEK